MVRRSPLPVILAGLCLSSGLLAFVSPSLPANRSLQLTDGAATSSRAQTFARDGSQPVLVGMAFVCCSFAMARRSSQRGSVSRKAEEEEGKLPGFLGKVKEDEEEEQEMKKEGAAGKLIDDVTWDDLWDNDINEEDLQDFIARGGAKEKEDASSRLAKMAKQDKEFVLAPSSKYVKHLACEKAKQTYSNQGKLSVEIAVITESIRGLVLHCRGMSMDERKATIKDKINLIMLVSQRRKMLDKLAWSDLDQYLKLRSELKIRHFYRMEALIGRWKPYVYGMYHRRRFPTKKTLQRLSRRQGALERRLAKQMKKGAGKKAIKKTQSQLVYRQWLSEPRDEAEMLIKKKPVTKYVDHFHPP